MNQFVYSHYGCRCYFVYAIFDSCVHTLNVFVRESLLLAAQANRCVLLSFKKSLPYAPVVSPLWPPQPSTVFPVHVFAFITVIRYSFLGICSKGWCSFCRKVRFSSEVLMTSVWACVTTKFTLAFSTVVLKLVDIAHLSP